MINFDSERGIAVTTTPGRRTHSQLSISRAEVSDSGNYTCAPSNSLPASIQVYVSGERSKFDSVMHLKNQLMKKKIHVEFGFFMHPEAQSPSYKFLYMTIHIHIAERACLLPGSCRYTWLRLSFIWVVIYKILELGDWSYVYMTQILKKCIKPL